MKKDERIKARAEGKIIIRAQYRSRGWMIVRMTSNGGWTPYGYNVFPNKEEPVRSCKMLADEFPDLYIDDNE